MDDNPTNCRILTLQSTKWGMIPRGTQSATQALDWIRAGEMFDVAILDMQMPGMDGLMLAAEIRKLPSAMMMPLVLLTSMGVRADSPAFTNAAFASCLTKPLKPVQLHETLVRVVSGAKPVRKSPTPSKLDPGLAQRLPLRLLLCDDNAINQKVALRLLQQMGYKADVAANGLEALAALDRQPYDFIFMDVQMPEMDGLEATRQIRERQRDRARHPHYKASIVIVAMTANAMQGDRERCLAVGMDDYLPKPVRPEEIRSIVERWGSVAAMNEAAPSVTATANTKDPLAVEPVAEAVDTPESHVDLARLHDFTDGNPENLRELVTLYLKQTAAQLTELEGVVRAGSATDVRRVAHSCAGASATCGILKLVPLLRELERQGYEEKLTNAAELCRQAAREFEVVRGILEGLLARHGVAAASINS